MKLDFLMDTQTVMAVLSTVLMASGQPSATVTIHGGLLMLRLCAHK